MSKAAVKTKRIIITSVLIEKLKPMVDKLFYSRKSSDARDQDFIHLSNSRHELHNFFGLPISYSKQLLRPQVMSKPRPKFHRQVHNDLL